MIAYIKALWLRKKRYRGTKILCIDRYRFGTVHKDKKNLSYLRFRFFQRAVMSSRVLPLVSGTIFQTKRAAARQMTP